LEENGVNGNNKRIVVIRDIPSNFIEEAILILKSETDTEESSPKDNSVKAGKKKDNEFLVKEAEVIINNYIKECKSRGIYTGEPVKKQRALKNRRFSINLAINIALACSIAFLLFVLLKLF
jgi:hypothetical protein